MRRPTKAHIVAWLTEQYCTALLAGASNVARYYRNRIEEELR